MSGTTTISTKSGDLVALLDLRGSDGSLKEALVERLVVPFHRDFHHHVQAGLHGLGAQQRDLALYDAAFPQSLDAFQAGRGRESHLVGQCLVGEVGIALQAVEDAAIEIIQ